MCTRRASIGIGVLFTLAGRVFGQLDSAPAFDIATVKLSQPGPRGPSPSQRIFEPGGQTFTARNATVRSLIVLAYSLQTGQVSGGPTWLDSEVFDIEARADAPTSRDRMRLMLQALLFERFKVTLHREMKELTVAALVVAKDNSKLQRTTHEEAEPKISFGATGNRSVSVSAQNVTLSFVADYLSGRLQQIVVDRTELTGGFDFSVVLTDDPEVPERDSVSYIFNDLVQKIGLRLRSQKLPIAFIVVEHAEKPHDN